MRPIPNSVPELIEDLEEHYPARCIEPNESPEAAHRYAGQVDLIATLRQRLEWTNEHARIPDVDL